MPYTHRYVCMWRDLCSKIACCVLCVWSTSPLLTTHTHHARREASTTPPRRATLDPSACAPMIIRLWCCACACACAGRHSLAAPRGPQLGPYKILPIFYCNKGGRGENILRNIVGNKGGLGGGHRTGIMCNNAPFSVSGTNFFSDTSTHPKSDP